MNRGSGNQWSGWDQGNSIPVNFSQPPSFRSSGYGNHTPQPDSGLADWRLNNRVPLSSFRQSSDARSGPNGMRQFGDSTVTGFPSELHPSIQIVLFDSMTQETRPRMVPFPRDPFPRFPVLQRNAHIQSREDLDKLEQEKALKMLKKVIYSSDPKNLTRRLSLFYNGGAGSSNATLRENSRELNEDCKSCAICLDDFEPGTEVMVTPCNHMFHEECILPWMKSNGQCPVCRFVISEQIKANAVALSNASAPPPPPPPPFFIVEDLPSSIRPRIAYSAWDMFLSSF